MIREFQESRVWVAANLVGVATFLWLASRTWIEPELRGEDVAGGGDAVVWVVTAMPVLAAVFALDLIWCAMVFTKVAKTRTWRALSPLAAMAFLWLCAVLIDLAKR
ncbi:hypothetical protein [Caulobacter sp. LARHSG274]